jgi:signal transduction histidine kinase
VCLGIRGMRERVRLVGGQFEIHSEPGNGTRIEACVPLLQP